MSDFLAAGRWSRSLVPALFTAFVAISPAIAQAEEPSPPPPPSSPRTPPRREAVDIGVLLGGAIRLGDAPSFDVRDRGGLLIGAGLSYYLQPFAVGLAYEHMGFGGELSAIGPLGVVRIGRQLDTLWAFGRVRVQGFESVIPFLQIGAGAVWQAARVDGVALLDIGSGSVTFACSARDSVNAALRFTGGVEMPLGRSVLLGAEASFDAYRLSSDVIDNCAPGAGTASAITLRAGLTYRFDLGPKTDQVR
jgi:hypothetical protein